jgi:hypothetical protein
MTAENLAKFRKDPNMPFWANLKEGSDHFEITKQEPKVAVCSGRYAFDTAAGCAPDRTLAPLVAEKESQDRQAVAELVAKGVPAVKVVYADGGGHDSFREAAMTTSAASDSQFSLLNAAPRRNLGDVSRPDALAEGPREIAIDEQNRATIVAAVSRKASGSKLAALAAPSPATAPAKGGRTVLASADPDQPILAPAPAAPEKPFYDRMMSGLIGGSAPAAPAPTTVAAVPEPPQRVEPAKTVQHKKPTTEVKAAPSGVSHGTKTAPIPEKHADTSGLIPGSAPIGPIASTFKAN